jgi:hypothetical protein
MVIKGVISIAKMVRVKCDICGEKIPKEEIYRQEYENSNGRISKKKGHEQCIKQWYREYCLFSSIREILIDVFNIKTLTKHIVRRIRELHKDYNYEVIRQAIINKRDVLSKQYIEKGWNYCFAIIENESARVYAEKQKQKTEFDNNIIPLINIKQSDSKKQNNIDITSIFE